MTGRASFARLPDGRRAHLQDGPIDLIIEAFGTKAAIDAAYAAASRRFATILDELCAELRLLRTPVSALGDAVTGTTARRMVDAVRPYGGDTFITPMAAVAGAVAEEVLAAMAGAARLDKIFVNNGGDIALHLSPDAVFEIGIVDRPDAPRLAGSARILERNHIRGIATSGWRGRSFSLGIADAVTILAESASAADAAATIVANAIDLPGHPAIERIAAAGIQPDSDLGDRLVTVGVGSLTDDEIDIALARGKALAERLIGDNRIVAGALFLKGRGMNVGPLDLADTVPLAAPFQPPEARRLMSQHG